MNSRFYAVLCLISPIKGNTTCLLVLQLKLRGALYVEKRFFPRSSSRGTCRKGHFQLCPVCGKPALWNYTRPVPSCSKECKKGRIRRRNVETYGVDHPTKTSATKEKQHRTMEERYGTAHALCNEDAWLLDLSLQEYPRLT